MKNIIRLTESQLHRVIKGSVKKVLSENTDLERIFARWDWSCFGADTAFFYFENKMGYLCVEYWADENTCAEWAQQYNKDGDYIEDEGKYLSPNEIEMFTNFCSAKINEE